MNYKFSDKVANLRGSQIREILKYASDPEVISFAAGNPAPNAFPVVETKIIAKEIFDEDPILALQYSVTEGYTPLRDKIKERMINQNNFKAGEDELIITSGAQQANELAGKVLCNEGDVIISESPSFIGSLNAFRSYNVKLVGVPMEEDGMNIEKLEEALKSNKTTKLIYVISNFQNPTGITTSFEKRKAIYALAQKYDVCILEDNPYGEISFDGTTIPSIKSLDTDGRVIYSGTFSKTLAPAIRLGYSSANKEIIQKMVVCKQVSDVHTNMFAQILAYKYLTEYDMDKHLTEIRPIYKNKCELMINEIEKNFSSKITITHPTGGLFLYCTLPDDCDMMEFCSRAVKEYKVAVVPGNAFMMSENEKTTSFRMNFSTPTDDQIVAGCEMLGKLSKEMFGE